MFKVQLEKGILSGLDRGKGTPVLLLPGLGMHKEDWQHLQEALKNEFRMIAFDPRGFGDSTGSVHSLTLDRLVDDSLAVLDALGIEQTHLIANSMGVLTAIALAYRAPHRLTKMVLLNPTASVPTHTRFWLRWQQAMHKDGMSSSALAREQVAWIFPDAFFKNPAFLPYLSAIRIAIEHRDPDAYAALLKCCLESDVRPLLHEIQTPTLLVPARDDRVFPIQLAEKMEIRMPHAWLEAVDHAGHAALLTQPYLLSEKIKRFLGQTGLNQT